MIESGTLNAIFDGQHVTDLRPLGEGNINDTYIGTAQGARWVIQRLNKTVFRTPEHVVENIATLTHHLKANDYQLAIPEYRITSNGTSHWVDTTGQYWRACLYMENTFAPERLPTAQHAAEAAKAYGHFVATLSTLDPSAIHETIPGFHDTAKRYAQLREAVALDPANRLSEVQKDVDELFDYQYISDKVMQLHAAGKLPLRVTHNDTKAGNILLDQTTGKAVAVIDWDTVMPGCLLSDFGDMVRTLASNCYEDDPNVTDLEVQTDILEALKEGYLSTTQDFLTPTERNNLILGAQWIIGEQAVRFMTDYLMGDVYYKTTYPTHNLVRARNQLALLHQLG
jgi:N-acetylhexosamine 1-kinase